MRNLLLLLALAGVVATVGGCCTVGLGSCQTRDKLVFVGADDLNSCTDEQSHPVTVRVYYLTDPRVFDTADFEALWWEEDATFGDGSLVDRRELKVYPGQSTEPLLLRPEGAAAVGLVANFCGELDSRCWRATLPLDGGGLEREITLEKTCMTAR